MNRLRSNLEAERECHKPWIENRLTGIQPAPGAGEQSDKRTQAALEVSKVSKDGVMIGGEYSEGLCSQTTTARE